jgi:hypothetical protein
VTKVSSKLARLIFIIFEIDLFQIRALPVPPRVKSEELLAPGLKAVELFFSSSPEAGLLWPVR